ncbi:MAG: preprotein translocase subunit SecA [Armatimonadetes bacterium]|nr:preprotein translocase subunit SecA [Armatimonadota bacterium]
MELTPLGGDLRTDIPAQKRRGPAPSNEGAQPRDTWLGSATNRLATAEAPPTSNAPHEQMEGTREARLRTSGPAVPVPTAFPVEKAQPLPGATPPGTPVVLHDQEFLTRPLTLEDLQAGRIPGSPQTNRKPTAPKPPDAVPHENGKGLLARAGEAVLDGLRSVANSLLTLVGMGDDTLEMRPLLSQVNDFDARMRALSDNQLKAMTGEFKARLAAGEKEDDLMPEAYAAVREGARRVLGMRPFDVQVLGGIALHQGRIAEMGTGEGKTLTAAMPVYLNALSGKGVHVVTVNETLAKRDCEQMGRLFNWMGLSCEVAVEGMKPDEKRKAYNADITYCTNVTLGFDFLRDNMAQSKREQVCRDPHFALVDEVDEILIDEARTPLIISELSQPSTRDYTQMAEVVATLKPGEDFKVNMKERQTWVTEEGLAKVEKALGIDNLYDEANLNRVHYMRAALIARNLFVKDKDYVVNDGKVDIVDEFTGRIMDGRRYNDGIHQALEAKEGVEVQPEQRTLASITYPNLFRRYKKLSGMSGTAKTEESEFANLYNLGVAVIPPNRKSQRVDKPDLVYKTYQEKFKAIADQVERLYNEGQPVLIGTRNIVINEYLHQILSQRKIPHQLLNAKSVKDNTEAENAIIGQAGKAGMVTLATNMAGRGVDVKPDYVNYKKLVAAAVPFLQKGERVVITVPKAENVTDVKLWMGANGIPVADASPRLSEMLASKTQIFQSVAGDKEDPYVQVVVDDRKDDEKKALPFEPVSAKHYTSHAFQVLNGSSDEFATGGLHVIGTERHESRRIDNQLKGRAARQGNPGETQFFVSLDDELMRLFGGDRLKKIFDRLGIQQNQAVQDHMLDKAIESAQKKVESMHFEMRKNTTKYDGVLNTQRDLMYEDRKALLEGADLGESLPDWASAVADKVLEDKEVTRKKVTLDKAREVWTEASTRMGLPATPVPACLTGEKVVVAKLRDEIVGLVKARAAAQEKTVGSEVWQAYLRRVTMSAMDEGWFEHLENMQELQSGIGLVAYGEQDPWIAYQKRGYEMWQEMKLAVEAEALKNALSVKLQPMPGMLPRQAPPIALK